MFYKNVLYTVAILVYGISTEFSGASFYDKWMDATINVFLTGLPIIWYGIFDWQYSKEELLSNHNLYKIGLKNKCLNNCLYWRWYIYATWQSIMLYWLSFETFNQSIGITYKIV